MKACLLKTLKALAQMGATSKKIEITSRKLGKRLETSQQTESRHILKLVKLKMIAREYRPQKQIVIITAKGKQELQKEYADFKSIFEIK